MERLHILDGYGYIFRAHYGLAGGRGGGPGVRLTTKDGMPTGALYVYARMLIRLYKDWRPERIAVVYDAPGRTFRDDLDVEYKATRHETPPDLVQQLPYFRPLTEALAWPVLAIEGVEADDVIATLACRARSIGWDVVIFSADKDLMSLVADGVRIHDSMNQIDYDDARVRQKFGVAPAQVPDWLALVGDTTDNIPGVEGIGKVTAAKLLNDHGNIDGVLAHVGDLKGKLRERLEDPEQLRRLELSRKLVKLRTDVDVPVDLEELRAGTWHADELKAMLERFEFHVLLESMDAQGNVKGKRNGDAAAAAAPAAPSLFDSSRPLEPAPAVAVAASPDDLLPVVEAARKAGRLGLHVECDCQRPDRSRIVGFGLAAAGVPPLYVPVAHRYLSAPRQLPCGELPPALGELLADPGIGKLVHDGKTARRALRRAGLGLEGVRCDALLATYLLDHPAGVDEVAASLAGVALPARAALLGKGKSAIDFEAVSVEQAAAVAGGAAAALLPAGDALLARLDAAVMRSLHDDLELPLARLLADIEDRGIRVDLAHLRTLGERVAGQIADLERQVFEMAGTEINLGSTKQLQGLLFDKLGLASERMRKTKTGFSTDADVLDSLVDTHPIVKLILEHRELVKLKGTYIDALPPLVNPATRRVHTSFDQAVATTGRLSSRDPNLQNIPIRSQLGRDIRRAFVAEPGKLLLSADYSQIELRIIAHMSGDPVLQRAFREGIDVHTQTAAEVFAIPLEEVGDHERRIAKAVNYGLAYGQSDFGLGRALDIPRAEARRYIEVYFERFSRVRQFMDELVTRARRERSAVTLLGRRRPIPDIDARNVQRRNAAERIALNAPVQGTGADIMKLAMLRADELIRSRGVDAAILLTVHDELIFEVAEDQAGQIGPALVEVMESVYPLSVPLGVDLGSAPNWADCHG